MKKITKPLQREEAVYYSDFSGKCFGEADPPVELKLDFGYGSSHDGSILNFHLDDDDVKDILFLLKSKLSNETKNMLKKKYTQLDIKYEDSVDVRDWGGCDFICNERDLLEKLI
jgi:hypothetical protein